MGEIELLPVSGQLRDHYDPRQKVIRLSDGVYSVRSVAALAVAAHEVGHALQDAAHFGPMALKQMLVPLAIAGVRYGLPLALIGAVVGSPLLVQIGLLAYVSALVLQLVALPIEFDASRRALRELKRLKIVGPGESGPAKSVLRAAALTHVAGAASSTLYLLYLALSAARWFLRKPLL